MEKWTARDEKTFWQAAGILGKRGSFVRIVREGGRFPFEAVAPGDWTAFQSLGISALVLERLQAQGYASERADENGRFPTTSSRSCS